MKVQLHRTLYNLIISKKISFLAQGILVPVPNLSSYHLFLYLLSH